MKRIDLLLEFSPIEEIQHSFYIIKGRSLWKDWDHQIPFQETFVEENMTQEDWAWIVFFNSNVASLRTFTDLPEFPETHEYMSRFLDDNPYINVDLSGKAEEFGFITYNGWDELADSFIIDSIEYHSSNGKVAKVTLPLLSEVFKSYKEFKEYFESITD